MFRDTQLCTYPFIGNIKIESNKQYVLCTLDFDEEARVILQLISPQYPSFKAINNKYVPQLLNTCQFTLPFKSKERRATIQTILKKRCTTTLTTKLIDMLTFEASYINKNGKEIDREHEPPGIYFHKVIKSSLIYS